MNAVLEKQKESVVALCQQYHVACLEVFGSAASGEFDPARSDLDFLVRFHPATPEEHADRYFGLLAGLQDLFCRHIDLVEINAVENPYFLQAIGPSRTVVYGN